MEVVDLRSLDSATAFNMPPLRILVNCCCPCFVLGSLESLSAREDPLLCNMGSNGLCCCCSSLFAVVIGWPCPCILTNYLFLKRQSLRTTYHDNNHLTKFSCADYFSGILLWPCLLIQISDFMHHSYSLGVLRFDWEQEVSQYSKIPCPLRKVHRVAIVGPHDSGKSVLFQKLLSTRSEKDELLVSDKVHIGIKSISASDDKLVFLEVWEVPEEELFTTMPPSRFNDFDSIVFIFDLSDTSMKSLKSMISMYEYCFPNISNKKIFCVCSKLDLCLLNYGDDHSSRFEEDNSQFEYRTECLEVWIKAFQWASSESIPLFSQNNYNDVTIAAFKKEVLQF